MMSDFQNLTAPQLKKLIDLVNVEQASVSSELEKLTIQVKEKKNLHSFNEDLLRKLRNAFESKADSSIDINNNAIETESLNKKKSVNDVSWWDKIQEIFKERNRTFLATEIITILTKTEKEKDLENFDEENLKKNIFATLSINYKKKLLNRYQSGNQYAYGLKDWFNDDGTLKDEYRT